MDLESLSLASALVSPFPTWEVEAADEPRLLAALASVGCFPQADIFEPWDTAECWRARVVFPDLEKAKALIEAGRLAAGEPPGLSEWLDRGRIGVDTIEAEGVTATCLSDLEQGGLLVPDFVPGDGPWMESLKEPLLEALGGGDGHRVSGVVHRSTGRLGVLVEVAVTDADPMKERKEAVGSVARVVAQETSPRLAPDLRWWFDMKRVFVLAWSVCPCGPGLPEDRFVETDGVDLSTEPGQIEVHVRFEPDAHDERAVALGEGLGAVGLAGSRARWSSVEGERCFLAAWEGEYTEELAPALGLLAPGTHRVVPGCPPGLEPDWIGIDPAWFVFGKRVVVRWHCALQDRDLLPVCDPRPPDEIDNALRDTLSALGTLEPVWAGRAGLKLRLPPVTPGAWEAVLAVIGAISHPSVGPVVHARLAGQTTLILYRLDVPARAVPGWQA